MAEIMAADTQEGIALRSYYLQAIQQKGFLSAHAAVLSEIKKKLDLHPVYSKSPEKAACQAVRMHTRLIFIAAFARFPLPPVQEIDRLFINVFGEFGRPALTQRLH